jgi:hypothetical protein
MTNGSFFTGLLPSGSGSGNANPESNAPLIGPNGQPLLATFGDLGDTLVSGGTASSGSSGSGSGSSPVSGSGAGLVINVTYDQPVSGLPSGFVAAINYVVNYYESIFTTPATVNIDVGYGEIGGQAMASNALGESESFLAAYNYSTIKSALATSDPSAAASLPASQPVSGTMWVSTSEAKALRLTPAQPTGDIDGYVGFSSSLPLAYDPNNRAVAGSYDFIGVVEHEFSEVMGRIDLFNATLSDGTTTIPNAYSLLDMFHYTSPGVHTYSGTATNYFSSNGGTTNLVFFNSNAAGDLGDWAGSAGADAYLAFSPSGQANTVSQADIATMNALGYNSVSAVAPTTQFDASWQLEAVGDFNGGGMADLAWQNRASGQFELQLLNAGNPTSTSVIANSPFGAGWYIATAGDFNGDGKTDLVFRSTSNQYTEVQLLNGATGAGGGLVANSPFDASWNIVGAGDFLGNGRDGVVWQRPSDGLIEFQFLNGTTQVGGGELSYDPFGPGWNVVGIGDFLGDGRSDLVWQRASDGLIEFQFMNGTVSAGGGQLSYDPFGLGGWKIVGNADFTRDGKSDLVWQRSTDGLVEVQFMNGTTSMGGGALVNNPFTFGWNVVAAKDFNSDGVADLAFQNTSTGVVQVALMSGLMVTGIVGVSGTGSSVAGAASANNPLDNANALLVQAVSGFGIGEGAVATMTPANAVPPDGLFASLAASSNHSNG